MLRSCFRRRSRKAAVATVLLVMLAIGCKRQQAATEQAEPEPPPLPTLIGIYTLSEIEHQGMVRMVPPGFATSFTFMADGTYVRVSKKSGQQDHTDSGTYQIQRADDGQVELVLKMIFANSQAAADSSEKTHKIELSEEGEVLRMSGTEERTAVFRRTASPPPK